MDVGWQVYRYVCMYVLYIGESELHIHGTVAEKKKKATMHLD